MNRFVKVTIHFGNVNLGPCQTCIALVAVNLKCQEVQSKDCLSLRQFIWVVWQVAQWVL